MYAGALFLICIHVGTESLNYLSGDKAMLVKFFIALTASIISTKLCG